MLPPHDAGWEGTTARGRLVRSPHLGMAHGLRSAGMRRCAAGRSSSMPPQPVNPHEEEGHWSIQDGTAVQHPPIPVYRDDGTENLTYSNPYNLEVERVWFDGHVVYAVEQGELEIEFDEQRNARGNKVAQEYQLVYAVELDEAGKLKDGQEP